MRHQWTFALRSVFRQRTRSLATLVAIAVGVAGLILAGGFVNDIFAQLGEAIIQAQTGYIQVTRQGYRDNRTRAPEQYLIDAPDAIKENIRNTGGVERVFARLNFSGVINNGKRDLGILGEGIEPNAEGKVGTYLNYVQGRPLSDSDLNGIVVGQGVAKSLGLNIGDHVNLVINLEQGAVNVLDFELVGIFQSFSKEFDTRAIRIHLASAHELMATKGAQALIVILKDTKRTSSIADELASSYAPKGYEIARWYNLSDFYEKAVNLYDRQFGVLQLIILLMVLLSVANSVNMSLFERTREFGTMIALGSHPVAVFRNIVLEGIIIGAIGATLGVALGCGFAILISSVGIPMPPPPNANLGYVAQIRLEPILLVVAWLIGFIATVLASIRPAWRMTKVDVVEALRHGS